MKEPNNIEEIFRETFKGFEADPGANAWTSIQSQLNGPIANASVSAGSNSGILATAGSKIITAIIAASLAGISVGAYFYFDTKAENQKTEKVLTEPKIFDEPKQEIEKLIAPVIQEPAEETIETPLEVEVKKEINKKIVKKEVKPVEKAKALQNQSPNLVEKAETESSKNTDKTDDLILQEEQISSENTTKQNTKTVDSKSVEQEINTNKPAIENSIEEVKTSEHVEKASISVPNIFTPNQDGVNDVFNIDDEQIESLRVLIYTKSGNLIHEWSGNYGFWDGKLPNGSIAPNDVYIYQISGNKLGQEILKKGMITLTR